MVGENFYGVQIARKCICQSSIYYAFQPKLAPRSLQSSPGSGKLLIPTGTIFFFFVANLPTTQKVEGEKTMIVELERGKSNIMID